MALNQIGPGKNVWNSDEHYTLCEVAKRTVRKFKTTGTDYHLSLNPQSNGTPLLDQLGTIFDSMVDEMTNGMAENHLVRVVLQSKSLDYPISLPFMPRHELMQNASWEKYNVCYSQMKMSTCKMVCKFIWFT